MNDIKTWRDAAELMRDRSILTVLERNFVVALLKEIDDDDLSDEYMAGLHSIAERAKTRKQLHDQVATAAKQYADAVEAGDWAGADVWIACAERHTRALVADWLCGIGIEHWAKPPEDNETRR